MTTRTAAFLAMLAFCAPATAEPVSIENGGDRFLSDDTLLVTLDGRDDVFAAASTAILDGATAGNLHAMGFDLSLGTETGGDLYAMAATVDLDAGVAGDASLMGFTLRTSEAAGIGGNLRMAANSVVVEGPVDGALTVMARTVVLDAPVDGDVRIAAGSLSFGENARINGTLHYSLDEPLTVPETVATPDRVMFTQLDLGDRFRDMPHHWPAPEMPFVPGTRALFGAFLVTLLSLLVLGALALAFFPRQLEAARLGIADAPGRCMIAGIAGFALLLGLVPVAVMTLVGIPFIPVVLLVILAAWFFGYALSAYALAVYVWTALSGREAPGTLGRLGLLAAALLVVALFNFIPFVGWVVNFTLVLLGIGQMTRMLLDRIWAPAPAPAGDDAQSPTAT